MIIAYSLEELTNAVYLASNKVVHGLCLMMAQVGNSDWQNHTTNNFVTYKT